MQPPPRPDLEAPIPVRRRRLPWAPIVVVGLVGLSAGAFAAARSLRHPAVPPPTLDTIASDYCHLRVELGGVFDQQTSAATFDQLGAAVKAERELVARAETQMHELAAAASLDGDDDLGLTLARLGDAFGTLNTSLEANDYSAISQGWRGWSTRWPTSSRCH
jgi:hypothetical protein